MNKKTAGLIGALAGLTTMGAAQAATVPAPNVSQALQASSYADLLAPVGNAVALMHAHDAARISTSQASAVRLADYDREDSREGPPLVRHDHHHHHHAQVEHHHHHHHQQSSSVGVPGVNVEIGHR